MKLALMGLAFMVGLMVAVSVDVRCQRAAGHGGHDAFDDPCLHECWHGNDECMTKCKGKEHEHQCQIGCAFAEQECIEGCAK